MDKIFPISEAAEYLGVFPLTLRNWEKKKLIKSFRTPGGHRRFKKSELDKIMEINTNGQGLEEVIEKLEKIEFENGRKHTVERIIFDLKRMNEKHDV